MAFYPTIIAVIDRADFNKVLNLSEGILYFPEGLIPQD